MGAKKRADVMGAEKRVEPMGARKRTGRRVMVLVVCGALGFIGCDALFGVQALDFDPSADASVADALSSQKDAFADGAVSPTDGALPDAPDGNTAKLCALTSDCPEASVCERYSSTCQDPNWAEWPMPGLADGGDAAPFNSHTVVGNTVLDNTTLLIWENGTATTISDDGGAPDSGAAALSQPEAIAYCQNLQLDGKRDWRAPTVIELISLVDYNPAGADDNGFAGPTEDLWTATPIATNPGYGWHIMMLSGLVGQSTVDTAHSVRCVR